MFGSSCRLSILLLELFFNFANPASTIITGFDDKWVNVAVMALCEARCYNSGGIPAVGSHFVEENYFVPTKCGTSACTQCVEPTMWTLDSSRYNYCLQRCNESIACSSSCHCLHSYLNRVKQPDAFPRSSHSGMLSGPTVICQSVPSSSTPTHLVLGYSVTNVKIAAQPFVFVIEETSSFIFPNWETIGKSTYGFIEVSDVQPDMNYAFRVTAFTSDGVFLKSIESPWINSIPARHLPDSPANVSVSFESQNGFVNAIISWMPPKTLPCHYKIFWYSDSENLSKHRNFYAGIGTLKTTLPKLHFGLNYTVAIMAASADGLREGPKTTTWFITPVCLVATGFNFTACGVTGKPKDVRVQIDCQPSKLKMKVSLCVSWKAPDAVKLSNVHVLQYRIVVDVRSLLNHPSTSHGSMLRREKTLSGNNTSCLFDHLPRAMAYEVSVFAVSFGGESTPATAVVPLNDSVASSLVLYVIVIPMTCALGLTLVFGSVYYMLRKRRNRIRLMRYFQSLDQDQVGLGTISMNVVATSVKADLEIDFNDIIFEERIGCGTFGIVYRAHLRHKFHRTVAVKMLPDGASSNDRKQLLQEIETLKNVGRHPNIVSLLACCTSNISYICLVVEYSSLGDLHAFLKSIRQQYLSYEANIPIEKSSYSGIHSCSACYTEINSTVGAHLTEQDLLSFARQIAIGMEYLSRNKFVHRDLAARNVLMFEGKVVKISDFGLVRDIYEGSVYMKMTDCKLPIKWMAIESIFDQFFTSKSDVWSFGVLLWEIASLGATPYPGIGNLEVIKLLPTGYRMDKPDKCSDEMYNMMRRCWDANPNLRPSFLELRRQLEDALESSCKYLHLVAPLQADVIYEQPPASCSSEKLANGSSPTIKQVERPKRSSNLSKYCDYRAVSMPDVTTKTKMILAATTSSLQNLPA